MPESVTHIKLVKKITEWIETEYAGIEDILIWVDSSQSGQSKDKKRIEGFIPDVYVHFLSNPTRIIGEAKTGKDFDKKHTENQIAAFIRHCTKNNMKCEEKRSRAPMGTTPDACGHKLFPNNCACTQTHHPTDKT